MDFLPCVDELAGADLDVLIDADGEVVVGARFDFAVGVDGVVFFGLELAVAVLFDGVVAFVADADFLVVFDVFLPVALGVDRITKPPGRLPRELFISVANSVFLAFVLRNIRQ